MSSEYKQGRWFCLSCGATGKGKIFSMYCRCNNCSSHMITPLADIDKHVGVYGATIYNLSNLIQSKKDVKKWN